MEKSGSRHGLKVLCIVEEPKTKAAAAAAEGREARIGAKRGGVIPAKRRLVKRMMWDRVVNWACSAFASCSSAACSQPVRANKTKVGAADERP